MLNPMRIYREHQAKEKRFQDYRDRSAQLERQFHKGPIENRAQVQLEIRKLIEEWAADMGESLDVIEARVAARAKAAGSTSPVSTYIDTAPLDGLTRAELAGLAKQLRVPVRGTDEALKRAILAENARQHALRAAAPDRLNDLAIRLWRFLANTNAGKKIGGWCAKFARDE